MRRGLNSEIIMKDNNFIGFNLGRDFCYEHEHGIEGLIKIFGMKINDDNVSCYITDLPNGRRIYFGISDVVVDGETHAILYALKFYGELKFDKFFLDAHELYGSSLLNRGFTCSWNKESFAILVKEEHRKYVSELYEAFVNKDITFSFGNEICDNSGLKIYISSKVK